MSTQTKSLEQLQQEFAAASHALEERKKLDAEDEKKQVVTSLKSAQTAFDKLDANLQDAIRSDPAIRLLFAAFEIPDKKKRKKGSGTGKNWRWNDETKAAVLEFVGATGKLQSEIITHFNSTSTTVIKWGKTLSAANLIKIDDTKRSNFWELVKA